MTRAEPRPPTVFISYSHDSQEHADHVLELSDHLRADGVDCILDQYEDSPPDGFPRWMDRQIRDADFVLMICTPTYFRRVMGEEEPGKGHGVAWESTLIYQYIYNAGTSNTRFIPILLEEGDESDIPVPWQGVKHYRPTTMEGYEDLYRRLTKQLLTPKPAPGTRRTLPPRARTREFVALVADERPLTSSRTCPTRATPILPGAKLCSMICMRHFLQHINRTATCVWKLLPRRSCLFRAPFTALGTSPRLKRRQRDRP